MAVDICYIGSRDLSITEESEIPFYVRTRSHFSSFVGSIYTNYLVYASLKNNFLLQFSKDYIYPRCPDS